MTNTARAEAARLQTIINALRAENIKLNAEYRAMEQAGTEDSLEGEILIAKIGGLEASAQRYLGLQLAEIEEANEVEGLERDL